MLLAAAACSSPEERAAEALAEYEMAFAAGNYEQARQAIGRVIIERDDVAEHWLRLARAELALQRYGPAYAAYSRALELDRANLEALQNLAELAFVNGRHEEAREHAERLLEADPRNAPALLTLGFIALDDDKHAEALAQAARVLAANPMDEGGLVLKARAMAGAGQSEEAAAMVEQAMRVRGTTAGLLRALADIYAETGDEAALQRTYARILESEPDDLALQLDRLRSLYRSVGGDRAVAAIRRLQQSQPDNRKLFEDIVEIWLEAPDGAVALASVRGLAAEASPAAKLAYGRFLIEKGAAADVERLMRPYVGGEVSPANADATALYAAAQHGLGRTPRALALANRVLAFDSAQPRALRLRARIAIDQRRFDQALADAQLLVRDQPDVVGHRLLLAEAHMGRGQVALTELVLKDAYKDFPESAAVFRAYADFLRRQDRTPAALALAEDFAAANAESRPASARRPVPPQTP